jgi:hypothetical protein
MILHMLIVMIAGWIQWYQQQVVAYLVVYLGAAGSSDGPVRSWLRRVNQPASVSPIRGPEPDALLSACLRAHLPLLPPDDSPYQLLPQPAAAATAARGTATPHAMSRRDRAGRRPWPAAEVATAWPNCCHWSARAAMREGDRRWRGGRWQRGGGLCCQLTGHIMGLAGEARKWLGGAGALAGWLGRR